MSLPLAEELRDFHQFLETKLAQGGDPLSPEEALDQWRLDHPVPDDLEESVAIVRRTLADQAAGQKGKSLDDIIAGVRERHQL